MRYKNQINSSGIIQRGFIMQINKLHFASRDLSPQPPKAPPPSPKFAGVPNKQQQKNLQKPGQGEKLNRFG